MLKRFTKPVKRILNNSRYLRDLRRPVDDRIFLLEAGQGKHINGNIFALLRVLESSERYHDCVPYLVIESKIRKEAEERLKKYAFKKTKLLVRQSKEYNRILATAKYLITDNSFPYYFHKREQQICLNTWHGTPLKRLGRADIENSTSIGNVQKNFLAADYLLFPNEYTKQTMMKDYMVDRLYSGKTIVIDYPRNDALFQNTLTEEIAGKYNPEGRRILAYMPTWRGTGRVANVEKQLDEAKELLTRIDASLGDDELLYVNFHFLLGNNVDFSTFSKIRKFPGEYETYDFLSICDTLISDYSSVMIDFAQTGKEVIMYMYDYEKYRAEKGFYFDIRTLPFVQVETVEELIDAIHSPQNGYELPAELMGNHFGQATLKILELLCDGNEKGLELEKRHTLETLRVIHFGDITINKHAALAKNYLKALPDDEKGQTVISFENPINDKAVLFLKDLDDDVQFLRLVTGKVKRFREYITVGQNIRNNRFITSAKACYKREYKRIFGGICPAKLQIQAVGDEELYYIASACEKEALCSGAIARISSIKYHVTEEFVKIDCKLRLKHLHRYAEPANVIIVGDDQYPCSLRNFKKEKNNDICIVKCDLSVEFKAAAINRWGIHNDMYILIRCDDEIYKTPVFSPERRNYFKKLMYFNKKFNCVYFFKEGIEHYRITVRERNVTDSKAERIKIAFAWLCALMAFWHKPILLYEKDCSRYEESASILYERLVDDGYKNVSFVLDKHYLHRNKISEVYKKYIIDRFSFRHYFNLFAAKTLISSEAVAHSLEVRTVSPFFRYFVERGNQNYVFLQHGVMYMVSLDAGQRSFFNKSKRKGKQRIVVSSKLEAQHFLDYTDYVPEDVYISGLIKFDKSRRDEDADRIVVMPTWRPWEYVQGINDFKNTGYYKFTEEIINAVPDELKDKLIVLPHPLILKQIETDEDDCIWQYYKQYKDCKYDDILRKSKILITDYSSISYDAFYRGCNIVFYWKEKDACLKNYGGNAHLMLTEKLAFGEVCYDVNELRSAIYNGYETEQSSRHMENFREIVEFHDGNNSGRLIEMMKNDGVI